MSPFHLITTAVLLVSALSISSAYRVGQSPSFSRSDENEVDQEQAGGDSSGGSYGGPDESSHDGSRVQFHVQGHKGPKSYRFGYDTGHGKHRQFRYEERDEHGVVHGRYGFRDKNGHMRVYHYTAHPHHGYHAKEANPQQYTHYHD